jgi:hypothetical protein
MDQIDESIQPDASEVNGTHAYGMEESAGAIDPTSTSHDDSSSNDGQGLTPSFLAELANAMKAAADRERGRISGLVSENAAAHVEKVRSRAILETEELRRLADQDIQGVEAWSAAEIERIRGEADQRIDDRRASLEEYLKQHDAIIETEISGVDAAVVEFHATLDRFFAELADTADPSDIVARAEHLPHPPDLDAVRAAARASAMSIFAEPEADTAPAGDQPIPAEAVAPPPIADAVAEPDVVAEEDVAAQEDAAAQGETAADVVVGADEPAAEADVQPTTSDEPYQQDRTGWYDTTVRRSHDGWDVPTPVAEPEPAPAETEMDPAAISVSSEEAPAPSREGSSETEPTPIVAALQRPIGVMDPDATINPGWPAPEPRPVAVTPTVDHTSAAVRLLRSVAPWTAPNQGGERSSDDE